MPIYEYECQDRKCGHRFEMLQASGEEPVTICPECEGEVRRIISPTANHFKGGRPSAERTHKAGKHNIPVQQTDDGHWEQRGIMGKS